jgi:hypothetical protein
MRNEKQSMHSAQLWLLMWVCVFSQTGCRERQTDAELKAGGGDATSFWLRSPESLVGTFRDTWELEMSSEEQWSLIYSVYGPLGGLIVSNQQAQVFEPNGPYVMAIDKIAQWASDKLLKKEQEKSLLNEGYMFAGFMLDPDSDLSCFSGQNDSWCPFDDKLKLGDLAAQNVAATGISPAFKRRMYHNMQDISDFLLLGFDNQLKAENGGMIFNYLLDEVLLQEPQGVVLDLAAEERIWKRIVYSMMMTGNFFISI